MLSWGSNSSEQLAGRSCRPPRAVGFEADDETALLEEAVKTRGLALLCRALRRASARPAPTDRGDTRVGRTAGHEKERVEGYSRGMRQGSHIPRGLPHDPPVEVLD